MLEFSLKSGAPSGDLHARQRMLELLRAPRLPIDLDALEWNDLFPGVHIHVLEAINGDPKRALIVIDAGAEVPEHSHEVPEDLLLLEGSLQLLGDGEGSYSAGDLFHSRAGSIHSARNNERANCLCYVVYWPPAGH